MVLADVVIRAGDSIEDSRLGVWESDRELGHYLVWRYGMRKKIAAYLERKGPNEEDGPSLAAARGLVQAYLATPDLSQDDHRDCLDRHVCGSEYPTSPCLLEAVNSDAKKDTTSVNEPDDARLEAQRSPVEEGSLPSDDARSEGSSSSSSGVPLYLLGLDDIDAKTQLESLMRQENPSMEDFLGVKGREGNRDEVVWLEKEFEGMQQMQILQKQNMKQNEKIAKLETLVAILQASLRTKLRASSDAEAPASPQLSSDSSCVSSAAVPAIRTGVPVKAIARECMNLLGRDLFVGDVDVLSNAFTKLEEQINAAETSQLSDSDATPLVDLRRDLEKMQSDFEQQLERYRSVLEANEANIESLGTQKSNLEQKLAKTEGQLAQATEGDLQNREQLKELQELVLSQKIVEEEVNASRAKNLDLCQQIRDISVEREEVQETNAALREQNEELSRRLEALTNEYGQYQVESSDAMSEWQSAVQSWQEEVARVQQELETRSQVILEYEMQLTETRNDGSRRIGEYERTVNTLNQHLETRCAEVDQEKVVSLERGKMVQALSKEVTFLQQDNENLASETNELKQQIELQQCENLRSTKELSVLTSSVDDLQTCLNTANDKIRNILSDLERSTEQQRVTEEQLTQLRQLHEEQSQRLLSIEEKYGNSTGEVSQLLHLLSEQESVESALREELEKVNDEVCQLREQMGALSTLNDVTETLKERVVEAEQSQNEWVSHGLTLQTALDEVQDLLEEREVTESQLRCRVQALNDTVSTLETYLQAEKTARVEQVADQEQKHNKEIEELRHALLQEAEARVSGVMATVASLESSLQSERNAHADEMVQARQELQEKHTKEVEGLRATLLQEAESRVTLPFCESQRVIALLVEDETESIHRSVVEKEYQYEEQLKSLALEVQTMREEIASRQLQISELETSLSEKDAAFEFLSECTEEELRQMRDHIEQLTRRCHEQEAVMKVALSGRNAVPENTQEVPNASERPELTVASQSPEAPTLTGGVRSHDLAWRGKSGPKCAEAAVQNKSDYLLAEERIVNVVSQEQQTTFSSDIHTTGIEASKAEVHRASDSPTASAGTPSIVSTENHLLLDKAVSGKEAEWKKNPYLADLLEELEEVF